MGNLQPEQDFSLAIALPKLPPGQGGMERQAYLQAKSLCKRASTTIISVSENPDLFINEPIRFICLRPYEGFAAKEVNALRIFFAMLSNGLFSRKTPIYLHQINLLTFLVLLFCRVTGQTVFIKLANSGEKFDIKTFFSRYPPAKFFKQVFTHSAFHYLCLNEKIMSDFSELGMRVENIYSFRNGVEIDEDKGEPVSNGYIQYIGRLEPIKEVDFVLDLAKEMEHIEFRIIGSGSAESALRAKQKDIENVDILGELASDDIPWNEVEWVILPSRAEGMSNVLLEAMAQKKGIICRRIEANRFVGELTNKVVWINGDAKSVAEEVSKLSGTQVELSKKFDSYSVDAVIEDLILILRDILGKNDLQNSGGE